MVERQDPDNFSRFPTQRAWELAACMSLSYIHVIDKTEVSIEQNEHMYGVNKTVRTFLK